MYPRLLLGCLILSAAASAEVPRASPYKREVVAQARAAFGPSAPVATLAAQLHQESSWKPDAVSRTGAAGLAQFMPATAADMAKRFPEACSPAQPLNPDWAIRCQMRYMKQLLGSIKNAANECEHWAFALSAYNGGLGWVNRDRRVCDAREDCDPSRWFGHVATANAGRSAASFTENRGYPERILNLIAPRYASWGRGVQCYVDQPLVRDYRPAPAIFAGERVGDESLPVGT